MVFSNMVFDSTLYLIIYLIIYNLILIALFWTFLSSMVSQFKTLNNLAYLSSNPYFIVVLTILLLSASGVPPLLGFFSKIFVLQIALSTNFFLIIVFFFFNLLISLYFYIQNIKYLHSNVTYDHRAQFIINSERNNLLYVYFSLSVLFMNILGFNYIDDLFSLVYWLIF